MVAQSLLVTVTGIDQPGITAALTQVLSKEEVVLHDIEQVVVRGQLTLCFMIDLDPESERGEQVLKELLFVASKQNQELKYRSVFLENEPSFPRDSHRYVATLMGSPVSALAMNRLSGILASYNANIDSIRRLSCSGLLSVEIALTLFDKGSVETRLKEELMQSLSSIGVDVALQRESLTRRSKRLVVLDMDSTLISIEVVDELARLHGVEKEVSEITHRAMNGGYDFSESLRRRVGLLKGLSLEKCAGLAQSLPLNEGATELIGVLKGLGYKVGIISGGFTLAAKVLQETLRLDFAYANELHVKDGVLTGEVSEPIIDAEKKADLLTWIAHKEQIPLDQTIAIGDGANDALMLTRAGLGIAFHAKPVLKKIAATSVSTGGLDRILYLLGMSEQDRQEFLEFASKSI